jgi:hypothetical protein
MRSVAVEGDEIVLLGCPKRQNESLWRDSWFLHRSNIALSTNTAYTYHQLAVAEQQVLPGKAHLVATLA